MSPEQSKAFEEVIDIAIALYKPAKHDKLTHVSAAVDLQCALLGNPKLTSEQAKVVRYFGYEIGQRLQSAVMQRVRGFRSGWDDREGFNQTWYGYNKGETYFNPKNYWWL